jgi:hypothetical protein
VSQPPPAVKLSVLETVFNTAPTGRPSRIVSTAVKLDAGSDVVVVGNPAGGVMVGLKPGGVLVPGIGIGTTIGSPCESVVVVEFIEGVSDLTKDTCDGTNGVTGPMPESTAVVLLPAVEVVELMEELSASDGSAGKGAVGPGLGIIAVVFQPPLVLESCVEFDDTDDGTSGVMSGFVVGFGLGLTIIGTAVPVPIKPELPNGEEELPASNVADAFHELSCDPFGLRPPVPVGLTAATLEPEPTRLTSNGVGLGSLMIESAGSVVAEASCRGNSAGASRCENGLNDAETALLKRTKARTAELPVILQWKMKESLKRKEGSRDEDEGKRRSGHILEILLTGTTYLVT